LANKNLDIIIGLPTYNNGKTINYVVRSAYSGLLEFFHNKNIQIVISDMGSTDKTVEVIFSLIGRMGDKLKLMQYRRNKRIGEAIKDILVHGVENNAKAIVILDPGLPNIKPMWMYLLINKILSGEYDVIAPYYYKHEYEAMITNFVMYPIMSAIFGLRIRNPVAMDCSLSTAAARVILEEEKLWSKYVTGLGIDVLMAVTAIIKELKIAQASLGKLEYFEDLKLNLAQSFREKTKFLFELMYHYMPYWTKITKIRDPPIIGEIKDVTGIRPQLIDWLLFDAFYKLYKTHESLISEIYNEKIVKNLHEIHRNKNTKVRISSGVWTEILRDTIVAYIKKWPEKSDEIVDAFMGLWALKVLSFTNETKGMSADEAEKVIINHAKTFETARIELLKIIKNV